MKLNKLIEILYNDVEFGFFKIVKFRIEYLTYQDSAKNILSDLIRIGLFSGSPAYYIEKDMKTNKETGIDFYGKYCLRYLETSDFEKLSFYDFTQHISESIEQQATFSINLSDNSTYNGFIIKIKDEVMKEIDMESAEFYELSVNETEGKVNISLSSIWDYLRCFVIIERKSSCIYRIDMGRD